MPTFRSGLLLAVLLLSACSMPILQDPQQTKTEKPITQNKATTEQTKTPKDSVDEIVNTVVKNDSANKTDAVDKTDDRNLAEQLETQKKLANTNFTELQNRVGNAPELPRILATKQLSAKEIDSAIQQLRSYISKTNSALASLNARVDDREKMAISGDLIQIFLSDTTVTHNTTTFKAQPLVGQWVRGESRVIRLKDNILFENPKSEDLHITFSESYQLVVNGEVISTVNPNKEKNNASFNVSTYSTKGTIVGKLDYRVVNSK
ncbi:hypothetical protein CYL31_07380 [Marinomonas sp. A3A]|uniref:hypothetical protein n=1 Tax=Marinomonas sp. A3A TaxID=2065312 RepID=UPI001BB31243|nr:hypothetical protein [Marinomonas sp. A3A]QUX91248.1 hypothetical protein CYL31_07380 [Marinomonas sp. A3A]